MHVHATTKTCFLRKWIEIAYNVTTCFSYPLVNDDPLMTALMLASNSAYVAKWAGNFSSSKQVEEKMLLVSTQETEMWCGRTSFADDVTPVTNLRKSSRSSLVQLLTKFWSIWKTLRAFASSVAGNSRLLATNSQLTSPWCTKHFSNMSGFFSISLKRSKVVSPFLNWSRIYFLFTRISWSINDCSTWSLFSGFKVKHVPFNFKIFKGVTDSK